MKQNHFKFNRQLLRDYFVLAIRLWFAYILIDYGWGKLTDGQFGVTAQELNTPLKELNLFRLSWYLADHQPFKAFIGISQIVIALALIFNRTYLIGAFMSIPIWLNILVWDMTFFTGEARIAFFLRLSWYLLLTFFIIWNRRDKVLSALRLLIMPKWIERKYPLWAYLLLPLVCLAIEGIPLVPRLVTMLLKK